MNQIAQEMNEILQNGSPIFYDLLSDFGKNIYMPKGIISQSGEAKKYAKKINASIGIAKEGGEPMYLASLKKYFNALSPSEVYPYAPPFGLPDLRKKWKEKIISENELLKDEDSISLPVVTNALTNGLTLVGDLFVDKDDEIIVPDKLWGNYRLIYNVRFGAKINTFPFFDDALTGLNTEGFKKALEASTKNKIIAILNFPNNPTGYSPTIKEVDEIVNALVETAEKGKKILVVVDDAYYGLLYDEGLFPTSIFSKIANLHPNIGAVKVDGFTKEFYVWGFRVGFVTFADNFINREAYEVLEKKIAASIRCSISNCSLPMQSILLKLLEDKNYINEKKEKYDTLKKRALKVKEIAYDKKYADLWDVYPFNSGYFMCLRIKGVGSNELRLHALKKYEVGTISINETDLRVAFSCTEIGQIEEIFEVLAKSIKELSS